MWRPFAARRAHQLALAASAAAERQAERDALLAAMTAVQTVAEKALTTATQLASTSQSFLDSFRITEAPQVRQFDEQKDYERYLKDHGYATPKELDGLNQMDQFKVLLDRLEEM